MDNGSEFVEKLTQSWRAANGIEFKYKQPGKPMQNAYIEKFNKTYRECVLDAYMFDKLDEVREVKAEWMEYYITIALTMPWEAFHPEFTANKWAALWGSVPLRLHLRSTTPQRL